MRQRAAFVRNMCGANDLHRACRASLPAVRERQGPTRSREVFRGPRLPSRTTACDMARRRRIRANADVAKSVDAADFNWSAHGETRGAEPLKVGESQGFDLSQSRAKPPPGEGVETRRAAPTAERLWRRDSPDHERQCGGGESRGGTKICFSKGSAGSSPAVRTTPESTLSLGRSTRPASCVQANQSSQATCLALFRPSLTVPSSSQASPGNCSVYR